MITEYTVRLQLICKSGDKYTNEVGHIVISNFSDKKQAEEVFKCTSAILIPKGIDTEFFIKNEENKMRVILLASYCDDDGCTDQLPCEDCVLMCNTADIVGNYTVTNVKDYSYQRDFGRDSQEAGND